MHTSRVHSQHSRQPVVALKAAAVAGNNNTLPLRLPTTTLLHPWQYTTTSCKPLITRKLCNSVTQVREKTPSFVLVVIGLLL